VTTRNWRVRRPRQLTDIEGRPPLISVGVIQNDADQFPYALEISRNPAPVILVAAQRELLPVHLSQVRDDPTVPVRRETERAS